MKVFITGGTGFVGRTLIESLSAERHRIVLLTRHPEKASFPENVEVIGGDPTEPGPWQEKAVLCEAAVNLAGASIFTRWSNRAKERILNSRVFTTQNLVDSFDRKKSRTKLLINASAVGFYGSRGDEELDETSPPGNDFLAGVTRDWEGEAEKAENYGVRVIRCRFGIVLGKHGGALATMVRPFRFGVGASFGSGKQWFSWIHERDLARILLFLIDKKDPAGPINAAAPHPVQNRELAKTIGRVLHRPVWPSVPGFVLKLYLGEFAESLLTGQKVLPKKLTRAGFRFEYPLLEEALQDLLGKNKGKE
ncbi:MAG: TIGR01777 family oxidoreductase [Candidatus Aminicenantes bacterium]|nr:TIGR01777 family oxidoreductase [Candidatus Aminicenantes bacterium]